MRPCVVVVFLLFVCLFVFVILFCFSLVVSVVLTSFLRVLVRRKPVGCRGDATMSSDLKGTLGKANVERRTWDKEEYRKRAQARMAGADDKEEFFATAPAGMKGPAGSKRAFLQARKRKVSVDQNLGKFQTINTQATGKAAGGYYCEVCDCTLRDSVAWVDHLNGRKHLRKLGYSTRVERSTVEAVAARLQMHKKARFAPKKARLTVEEYEKALAKKQEEKEAVRRKQLEENKKKKQQKKEEEEAAAKESAGNPDSGDGQSEAEMMAMMGFSGFGSSKKQR